MRYTRRHMFLLFTVTLPVLLVGIFCWLTYREVRQTQRNHALITAAKRNDVQAVTALLEQGAKVDVRDGAAKPISFWRLALDRLQGYRSLPPNGPTALLVALEAESEPTNRLSQHPIYYTQVIKALLDKGAATNLIDYGAGSDGYPLIMAAWSGDLESVKALLDHGAKIELIEGMGGGALTYAVRGGSLECLQILMRSLSLNSGRLVKQIDLQGDDALICAADSNRLDMMRLLLDHGADPKATNAEGTTALSLMVRHGNTAAVKLMLSRRADPGAIDIMGRSCLSWLRGKPHSEIAALLRQAGATK